ncbi:uncharacterized protein [Rutidosis leptorrhynchoides]|uniref:uncharacterized protein n=1 Tax=Rutidosis leptorrhynchoides TaxID=125765 RepID=UPI003A9921B2
MDGLNNWIKTERLKEHVGHVNSFHNTTLQKCQSLKKPNQSIANAFNKQDEKSKTEYRMLLSATVSAFDESSDVSKKEQMAIVLRYVDAQGLVKKRFVGIVHVKDTPSLYLKASIDSFFFTKHKVSMQQSRGQGYDGASNMRVVVAVAKKKHFGIVNFFDKIVVLLNVVCASCKRKDILIDTEKERVEEQIGSGKLETERGLNQELSLTRPGDTRWNSHYDTLVRLVDTFPSVIKVLEFVKEERNSSSNQNQAIGLLKYLKSFVFVFNLHLMLRILGVTNVLSKALRRKDQDILEAVQLVKSTKEKVQELRINGFELFLTKVSSFCGEHGIRILKMNEDCINSRRQREKINNQ